MQIFILALALGIFIHDGAAGGDPRLLFTTAASLGVPPWALLPLMLVPKLALAGLYFGACRATLARLGRTDTLRALGRLDRLGLVYRLAALGLFSLDLWGGGLDAVRDGLGRLLPYVGGDLILVDEVLFLLPTLALPVWAWWAFYPVERRLREAAVISRLDQGGPLPPLLTRRQSVLAQARHHFGLMFLPLLLLMGWIEIVNFTVDPAAVVEHLHLHLPTALVFLGALAVFLFAPVMIRHLWDTQPLPPGEVRTRLLAMCRTHHVGVRDLLLWRTFGSMINAAVMGVVAPLRYILLTDGLLEMLPAKQVEAVMAHELAHVRRHHLFWLLLTAMTTAWGLEAAMGQALAWLPAGLVPMPPEEAGGPILAAAGLWPGEVVSWGLPVVMLGLWLGLFGWVSRRFERQADTFAVQHLARERAAVEREAATGIEQEVRQEPRAGVESPPSAPGIGGVGGGWDAQSPGGVSFASGHRTAHPLPTAPSEGEGPEGVARGNGHAPVREGAAAAPILADAYSVETMVRALQQVADLNCIPARRRSWRHGSIAWRQRYLRSLVGRPIDRLPIDRLIRLIKLAAALLLTVLLALQFAP